MSLNKELKKFLKSNKKKVMIYCKPKRRGNLGAEWYRWRNPILMLFRGAMNEAIKYLPPCKYKNWLYRTFFNIKIGKDVVISPAVHFDPLFPELITIKDNAILGWGSVYVCHDVYQDKLSLGRIVVGEKVLIGGYALIQLGATVGDNSTVGKCALVLKDVEEEDIVGGVPAKSIKGKVKSKLK